MFRYINVWRMYQLSLRALFASFFYQSRAVGRFENLGGHNLLFLVGIRLADLTKSGGAITPFLLLRFQSGSYGPAALGNTSLLLLFDSFLCMIQLIDFFSCYSQGVALLGQIAKTRHELN